jgi:hypothetical protein
LPLLRDEQAVQIATGLVQNGVKVCLNPPYSSLALLTSKLAANQVYITARNRAECDKTAQELTKMGPGICVSIPADMQHLDGVKRLVEEVANQEKGECSANSSGVKLTNYMVSLTRPRQQRWGGLGRRN